MGLQDKIREEIKSLEREKDLFKEKKWKFPVGKKTGKGQRKKNYVTVLIINENGNYDFKKYQVQDQTFIHDLIPRLASSGHVMFNGKGIPLIILPSWSVEPFSPLKHYKESLIDGSNTAGYKLLLNRMESEKMDGKKKIGGAIKWIIGGIVGAIILYAILSGGGA